MRAASRAAALGAFIVATAAAAESRIDDAASATEAAKRYLKGRCTTATPCTFKPERDGKQWRVWVQLTRRDSPRGEPHPYPGGQVILFFDQGGNLIRRLEGD